MIHIYKCVCERHIFIYIDAYLIMCVCACARVVRDIYIYREREISLFLNAYSFLRRFFLVFSYLYIFLWDSFFFIFIPSLSPSFIHSLSLYLSVYIYIYIYIYQNVHVYKVKRQLSYYQYNEKSNDCGIFHLIKLLLIEINYLLQMISPIRNK